MNQQVNLSESGHVSSHNVRNDAPFVHQDVNISEEDVEQRYLQARRIRSEVGWAMRFDRSTERHSEVR